MSVAFAITLLCTVSIVNAENDGYKLFFDGKRVGHEPEWDFDRAIQNLLWNKKQYPDKEVEGYLNGLKIQTSGIGYELYFDGKRVGHEREHSRILETINNATLSGFHRIKMPMNL